MAKSDSRNKINPDRENASSDFWRNTFSYLSDVLRSRYLWIHAAAAFAFLLLYIRFDSPVIIFAFMISAVLIHTARYIDSVISPLFIFHIMSYLGFVVRPIVNLLQIENGSLAEFYHFRMSIPMLMDHYSLAMAYAFFGIIAFLIGYILVHKFDFNIGFKRLFKFFQFSHKNNNGKNQTYKASSSIDESYAIDKWIIRSFYFIGVLSLSVLFWMNGFSLAEMFRSDPSGNYVFFVGFFFMPVGFLISQTKRLSFTTSNIAIFAIISVLLMLFRNRKFVVFFCLAYLLIIAAKHSIRIRSAVAILLPSVYAFYILDLIRYPLKVGMGFGEAISYVVSRNSFLDFLIAPFNKTFLEYFDTFVLIISQFPQRFAHSFEYFANDLLLTLIPSVFMSEKPITTGPFIVRNTHLSEMSSLSGINLSIFGQFYIIAGVVSIVIGMLLFGMLCGHLYRKYLIDKSMKNLLIYMPLYATLFMLIKGSIMGLYLLIFYLPIAVFFAARLLYARYVYPEIKRVETLSVEKEK